MKALVGTQLAGARARTLCLTVSLILFFCLMHMVLSPLVVDIVSVDEGLSPHCPQLGKDSGKHLPFGQAGVLRCLPS